MDMNNLTIPQSIAFIMDGNGRWAQARGMKRTDGHLEGAKTLDNITGVCYDKGIKNITFYAFSTENWKRPKEEVGVLMDILSEYLKKMMKCFEDGTAEIYRHTEVRFIGDTSVFNVVQRRMMNKIIKNNPEKDVNMVLNIAINYGGRAEIVHAVNEFIKANPGVQLTEQDICDRIYTHNEPDPDLIIRTAGEMRLSNFLLWQAAYSEYYATPVCWPDFNEEELDKAILEYNKRTRKFGGIIQNTEAR